jgi:hypothetical protein
METFPIYRVAGQNVLRAMHGLQWLFIPLGLTGEKMRNVQLRGLFKWFRCLRFILMLLNLLLFNRLPYFMTMKLKFPYLEKKTGRLQDNSKEFSSLFTGSKILQMLCQRGKIVVEDPTISWLSLFGRPGLDNASADKKNRFDHRVFSGLFGFICRFLFAFYRM